jgi:hypothetical protein
MCQLLEVSLAFDLLLNEREGVQSPFHTEADDKTDYNKKYVFSLCPYFLPHSS